MKFQDILELFLGNESFHLIGYSFGSLLTLEIAKLLESRGKKGRVTMIDGSPQLLHRSAKVNLIDSSEENIQSTIMMKCIRLVFPDDFVEVSKKVFEHNIWDKRLKAFLEVESSKHQYSEEYVRKMLNALVSRIKIIINADKIELPTLEATPIHLIKPKTSQMSDLDVDYGLGKHTSKKIKISEVEGNHVSILKNTKLLTLLNDSS